VHLETCAAEAAIGVDGMLGTRQRPYIVDRALGNEVIRLDEIADGSVRDGVSSRADDLSAAGLPEQARATLTAPAAA